MIAPLVKGVGVALAVKLVLAEVAETLVIIVVGAGGGAMVLEAELEQGTVVRTVARAVAVALL